MSITDKLQHEADEQEHQSDIDALLRRAQAAEQRASRASHELSVIKRDVHAAQTAIAELDAELASFKEPVHELPPWQIETTKTDHRAILFSLLSDWHTGEVIDPVQMNGLNAFNYEISQVRSGIYFDKLVDLPRKYIGGRTYEGIILACAGDNVSGSIHDELAETDEFSVLESCRKHRDLMRPGVKRLSDTYPWVHLYFTPGNHGRDSKKPRAKGRAAHNADTHIGYLVRDMVRDMGLKNVTVDISEGFACDFPVYDVNFRLEHLDAARGGNGVMGILAPLPRLVLRRQQQSIGERRLSDQMIKYGDQVRSTYVDRKMPDVICGGHWHQLVDARGQGFLVNGAFKGYDEYARLEGFAPERPQQGLWVITPERGITTFEPIHVDNRKVEGW